MMDGASHINTPFHISKVRLPNRLVQAPMAGISGRAFRRQARRFGASLTATEMISSYGVNYGNRRTLDMLALSAGEHPVAVQLFGNSPAVMAAAAAIAEAAGADIIDINMGCPVRKVVKTGAGAALMEDEKLAAEIVAKVAAAVGAPVTAKIRSGARSRVTAPSLAPRLQEAGATAITVHPRLGDDGRKGRADHSVTKEIVDIVDVPVIASGDIGEPGAAEGLLAAGCSAVMVAQAALGNPWLFSDMLEGRRSRRRPLGEVLEEMGAFYADLAEETGAERAGRAMRKFYGWYLRPFQPGAALAGSLRLSRGFEEAAAAIREAFGR